MARKKDNEDHPGLWRKFEFPGPVGQAWAQARNDVDLIVGPYGSWKTSTAFYKSMVVTALQHPCADGVRKARILATRKNYRTMHKSLIQSADKFFGNGPGVSWPSREKDGPCTLVFEWQEYIANKMEKFRLTIEFMAFLDQDILEFLAGQEFTASLLNEFDQLPRGAISKFASRMNRAYLDEKTDWQIANVPAYSRVFGDCNMPDLDNWVQEDYIIKSHPDVGMFIQPSALSPEAEGLPRKDPTYVPKLVSGYRREGAEWKVKRYVENRAGYSVEGAPIYPQFDQDRHIAETSLQAEPGIKVVIGLDQGGDTSAVFSQKNKNSQVLILDELVPEPDEYIGGAESAKRIIEHMRQSKILSPFLARGRFKIVGDSAWNQRNAATTEDDPRTFITEFQKGWESTLGWSCAEYMEPWQTSVLEVRIKSVRQLLLGRTMDAGHEMLLLDPKCVVLARGFSGGYRRKESIMTPGQFSDKPEKNKYSHPHDALQAAAMHHVRNYEAMLGSKYSPVDEMMTEQLGMAPESQNFCEPVEVIM